MFPITIHLAISSFFITGNVTTLGRICSAMLTYLCRLDSISLAHSALVFLGQELQCDVGNINIMLSTSVAQ